jgi:hypothetical protein
VPPVAVVTPRCSAARRMLATASCLQPHRRPSVDKPRRCRLHPCRARVLCGDGRREKWAPPRDLDRHGGIGLPRSSALGCHTGSFAQLRGGCTKPRLGWVGLGVARKFSSVSLLRRCATCAVASIYGGTISIRGPS